MLAGWALVGEAVADRDVGYLVIQESHIEYLKPVDGDFRARAAWPADARARFLNALARKGLARTEVTAEILVGEEVRARLGARFVAEVKSR